jgi:hypothetical protein
MSKEVLKFDKDKILSIKHKIHNDLNDIMYIQDKVIDEVHELLSVLNMPLNRFDYNKYN